MTGICKTPHEAHNACIKISKGGLMQVGHLYESKLQRGLKLEENLARSHCN